MSKTANLVEEVRKVLKYNGSCGIGWDNMLSCIEVAIELCPMEQAEFIMEVCCRTQLSERKVKEKLKMLKYRQIVTLNSNTLHFNVSNEMGLIENTIKEDITEEDDINTQKEGESNEDYARRFYAGQEKRKGR